MAESPTKGMPDYTYDLFLSYAQADAPWVRSYFTPALGLPADRVIQPSDFRPGASLLEELERAVKSSRYTLLILSPAFLADQWASLGEQLAAYLGAAGQAERIIPLVLHTCDLPLRIEFRVRLDCTEEDEWDGQVGRLRGLFDLPDPGADTIECPYPGMAPFTAERADAFYGREDEIEFMLQHLRHQKFLLVVGPSGSGKSSLITAGLLPKLDPSGAAAGYFQKRPWLVAGPMRPAASPWQSLSQALGGNAEDVNACINDLLAAHPGSGRVLLVVDQFEELFTQGSRDEQRRFIAALKRLREHEAAAVIVAMRADFYSDLLKSDLWPVDPSQRLDVGPLKGDALRRAIEKPAADKGVYIEARLVDRLMVDASDAPGALPLLQETLLQLWERRLRRFLPYSAYVALSGGKGSGLAAAISQKADATLAELGDPACGDRDIARRIFLRLVQFGEGRADTRRQQPISALQAEGDAAESFDKTLSHLSDNRLIALSGDEGPLTGGTQNGERKADIAHEALFQGWPTLTGWVAQYRVHELMRRDLDGRARDWTANARANERLLNRVQLGQASEWLAKPEAKAVGHTAELTELVAVSRRYQERARLIRFATTAAMVLLAVLALLSWGLGQQANAQAQATQSALEAQGKATAEAGRRAEAAARATAEANRTLALRNESQAWAELASQDLPADPVASLWWSSRALPAAGNARPAIPAAEYQLRAALQQSLEVAYADVGTGVTAAKIDVDGPAIAVGGADLTLWPHGLGAALKQLPGPVQGLRWHTDGSLFAYNAASLTVWRNDVAFRYDLGANVSAAAWRPGTPAIAVISGRQVSLWTYQTGDPQVLGQLSKNVEVRERFAPLAWSADGASLAAWDTGGDLLLYGGNLPGDPPTTTLKLPARVADGRWSPDGASFVALLNDGRGLVLSGDMKLDAARPFTASVSSDAGRSIGGLTFVDADRFITWGLAAAPKLWSLADLSAPEHTYQLRTAAVGGISLAPDGTRFAAFGENGDVDVFPIDEEQPLLHLQGHSRLVVAAAWKDSFLATGGSDGWVRLWDLRDGADRPERLALPVTRGGAFLGTSYVTALQWQGEGRLLASAEDGSVRVLRVLDGDGEPLCSGRAVGGTAAISCAADSRALRGHEARLTSLQWLDAGTLLSADRAGAARRWELSTAETRLLPADPDVLRRAIFSPDGAKLFTYRDPKGPDGPGDGAVWDVRTGQQSGSVTGPIAWAAWATTGLLVGRQGETLVRTDPASGATLAPLDGGPNAETVAGLAVSGSQLALATWTGSLYIWRDLAGKPLILSRGDADPITSIAFSPEGKFLATAGTLVELWDIAAHASRWISSKSDALSCPPEFSPDGAFVAGCLGSTYYVWDSAGGQEVWSAGASGRQTGKGVAWRSAPAFDGAGTRLLLLTWAADAAQLWDWDARAQVGAYRQPPELNLAAISPDGRWLASTDDVGEIRLWNLSLEEPQGLLRTAVERITRSIDQ